MSPDKLHDDAASKGEDKGPLIVPLPNVCNCTLQKVLGFCEQQQIFDELCTASPAAQQADLSRQLQAWQKEYMQVTFQLSSSPAPCGAGRLKELCAWTALSIGHFSLSSSAALATREVLF